MLFFYIKFTGLIANRLSHDIHIYVLKYAKFMYLL